MDTTRLTQARKLFKHPDVDPRVMRHNIRQWARSVRYLGNNWLLAQPVKKEQT